MYRRLAAIRHGGKKLAGHKPPSAFGRKKKSQEGKLHGKRRGS